MADEIQKKVIVQVEADTQAAQQNLDAVDASINKIDKDSKDLSSGDWGAKKVKDLRTELQNAEKSADKFGNEIDEAGSKIATLDKKKTFEGITGGLQGTVGAVQTFTGALAIAGVDLGGFEKTLTTMAGLASLRTGLQDAFEGFSKVKEGIAAYNASSKAGAVASRLLGGAMNTIPLLAIITAVVLLITHWKDLVGWFEKGVNWIKRLTGAYDEQEAGIAQANKTIKEQQKLQADTVTAIDKEITYRKAAGQETFDQEKRKQQAILATSQAMVDAFKVQYQLMKAEGRTMTKDQTDAWLAAQKAANNAVVAINVLNYQFLKKRNDAQKSADDKAAQQRKAANDKAIQDEKDKNKALEEEQQRHYDSIKENQAAASDYLYQLTLTDSEKQIYAVNQKYSKQIEEAIKYGKDTTVLESARIAEIQKINRDAAQQQLEADAATTQARKDAILKAQQEALAAIQEGGNTDLLNNQNNADLGLLSPAEKVQADWEARKKALDAAYKEEQEMAAGNTAKLNQLSAKYVADTIANDKKKAAGTKAIDAATQKEKEDHYNTIGNLAGAASKLLGESTVAGKAFGIAQATIDTYVGASKALAQGGFWGIAQAAVVIASGLANVKAIIATKVDSTAQGVVPTAATPGAAPIINTTVLNRSTEPEDLNQTGSNTTTVSQPPIRAYITNKDIKDNNSKNQLTEDLSTF